MAALSNFCQKLTLLQLRLRPRPSAPTVLRETLYLGVLVVFATRTIVHLTCFPSEVFTFALLPLTS